MALFPFLAVFAAALPLSIAPPPGAELVPASTIVLTTSTADAGVRAVDLHCEPSGGSHPRAREACEDLLLSDGDVQAVRDSDSLCTLEYRPVHVTAIGSWRGEERTFDHVYANACAMRVDTGSVFQF
ncbi:SSI family serine proteinase inhibitor [Umezawaea sp. NPDC059074]|uniref:SSI family serine proteinase inhibitor n=1 Tax=Umezawaea sp. NPDC059074 TaxID=3346716 RepID=UPI00369C5A3D